MMHELRKVLAGAGCHSVAAGKPVAGGNPVAVGNQIGRQLRLAVGLAVLAIPLSGCGTGSLWDKFLAKDDTFVEEPADRRRRRRNSRKSIASILIPTGRANRC